MTHSNFDLFSKLLSRSGAAFRRENWHKSRANQDEHGWFARVLHLRRSIELWIRNRLHECVRCRGCQSEVSIFEPYCPRCGQAYPARVSTTAVVYLAIGFAFLTFMLWFLF
jgi:hypothetical protein